MTSGASSWSKAVLRLVRKLNNFSQPGSSWSLCKPFLVDGVHIGHIPPAVLPYLQKYPNVFLTVYGPGGQVGHVTLVDTLTSFPERTQQVAEVMKDLKRQGAFTTLLGWRDEMYAVAQSFHQEPFFMIERAATCLLGVTQYGVHVNGFFRSREGGLHMWIARRSSSKQTYPGKLDQLSAGGISCGTGILQTLVKECAEEASIPADIAKQAIPVGTVSYFFEDERGLFPEVQFVFDLEVSEEFRPASNDGEVEQFYCLPIAEVKEKIATEEFKPNCALVVLDFLIRHGLITPDSEPFYLDFMLGMHRPPSWDWNEGT